MEYYLATKSNKLLIHGTGRMSLENLMLNKRSETQKSICCIIPLI